MIVIFYRAFFIMHEERADEQLVGVVVGVHNLQV